MPRPGLDKRIVALERWTMPRPSGRLALLAETMDPVDLHLRFIRYCYGENRGDDSAGTGATAAEREAMHADTVAFMAEHFGPRWFDAFGFDHSPGLEELDALPEMERRRAVDLLARGNLPAAGATETGAFGKVAVSTKLRSKATPE